MLVSYQAPVLFVFPRFAIAHRLHVHKVAECNLRFRLLQCTISPFSAIFDCCRHLLLVHWECHMTTDYTVWNTTTKIKLWWYFWKVTREVMKYHRVASWSTRGAAECTSGCHEVILHYFKCYFSRYSSSGGCLVGFLVYHEMAITPCFRTMLSSSVVF